MLENIDFFRTEVCIFHNSSMKLLLLLLLLLTTSTAIDIVAVNETGESRTVNPHPSSVIKRVDWVQYF